MNLDLKRPVKSIQTEIFQIYQTNIKYIKLKQKQTILFLTRLYHPHIGGVEKHVNILSKMLIKMGYRVIVVTEQFDSSLPTKEYIDKVEIYRVPLVENHSRKKFLIWKWVIANRDLFLGADIIHAHDIFFWILPLLPFLSRRKVFTTFHGYEGYPIKKKWIVIRKITEGLSGGTICIGDFMKKWYKAAPNYISYGGVTISRKNTVKKDLSAVFFGRLENQTGILEYVSAYKLLKKTYPKLKFTVIGDGPLSDKLPKDIIRRGFEPNIEEFISQHRFIFVSRYLSMLEAMIQKKEVIAIYSDPIKKDYLKMSPFKKYIHIAKNSHEIAQFVDFSIKNGPDKQQIEAGHVWAENNSWKKVLSTYLALWDIAR